MENNHDSEIIQIREYLRHQDFDSGLQAVSEVLYEDPDYPAALCLQGIILTETGHQEEALKALEFSFKCGESSPEAWEAYGCAHLRSKHWVEAETALEKARNLDPTMASVWRNLGMLYSLTMRPKPCHEALKMAYQLDPNDLMTLYAYSASCLSFGEMDQAHVLLARLAAEGVPPQIRDYARNILRSLDQSA